MDPGAHAQLQLTQRGAHVEQQGDVGPRVLGARGDRAEHADVAATGVAPRPPHLPHAGSCERRGADLRAGHALGALLVLLATGLMLHYFNIFPGTHAAKGLAFVPRQHGIRAMPMGPAPGCGAVSEPCAGCLLGEVGSVGGSQEHVEACEFGFDGGH